MAQGKRGGESRAHVSSRRWLLDVSSARHQAPPVSRRVQGLCLFLKFAHIRKLVLSRLRGRIIVVDIRNDVETVCFTCLLLAVQSLNMFPLANMFLVILKIKDPSRRMLHLIELLLALDWGTRLTMCEVLLQVRL